MKMSELENRHRGDLEQLEEQMAQTTENIAKERDFHYQELQKTKAALQELEKDSNEIASNYDKDKALWDGKIKFLEQQRDQAKADQAETQRKLMDTLEQLQKRVNNEKDKQEMNPMQAALEAKVRDQLKEKQEQLNTLKTESSESIRQIEKENRDISSKL
jgi:DNA repair exonuclease SbcCD ATPase subunit